MSRALDLRENQVRAIIRAARKEGARVEVKIGAAVVAVFPAPDPKEAAPVDGDEDFRL